MNSKKLSKDLDEVDEMLAKVSVLIRMIRSENENLKHRNEELSEQIRKHKQIQTR